MFLTTKKNWETFDNVFDSIFNDEFFKNRNYQYTNSKLAIEILDDKAVIALSVLGHDKEDISIELHEDVIYVKSAQKELTNVQKQLISKIEERINVGDKFDGEKAEAKIINGILYLNIPKKEEAKPKKLAIKVG
jgi:HSP20 family protein